MEATTILASIGSFAMGAVSAALLTWRFVTDARLQSARSAGAAAKAKVRTALGEGQEWYWTQAWQKGEREADEDIRAGRTRTFETAEDFIEDLERTSRDARIS
jgi:hypothetical protein